MMFPSRMHYVVAAVLESHATPLSHELLRLGVLHFVAVREMDRSVSLRGEDIGEEKRRISEIRRSVESAMATGNISLPDQVPAHPPEQLADPEEAKRLVEEVQSEVESLRAKQRELQQTIMRYEELDRQVASYGDARRIAESSEGHGYLDIQTGSLPEANLEAFRRELSAYPATDVELRRSGDRVEVMLLSLKRNKSAVDEICNRFDWEKVELPEAEELPADGPATEVHDKLEAARKEQQRVAQQVVDVVAKRHEELEQAWQNLRHTELLLDTRSYFEHTDRAVLFSGWVPHEHVKTVDEAVRRVTGGYCYLTWHSGEKVRDTQHVSVPVQLKNPRSLKPFQMLVENFGTPDYGTVDPTIFVAITYLIMFGMMFGDAGQGLVLILIGFLGLRSTKVTGRIRQLCGLLTWCGGSAVVFGVLFGGYFGMQWFPPIWFDFHAVVAGHGGEGPVSSMLDVLVLTVYLGIGVLGLGFILNWINLVRAHRWLDVVFDRAGLLTAWLYGGGIYAGFAFGRTGFQDLPSTSVLVFGLAIPALLMLLKEPAEALFGSHGDDGHAGKIRVGRVLAAIPGALMNWVLELLEVASGYLSNTLSFMRVAGLGIAHVTLMIAFFDIAEMASGGDGFSIGGLAILIFGNALVIGLEGLSAGIQSLRLNYYEFFSKYFSGSGEAYRPISLAGRA
ncbi:MAG: V-type ATP synthase subunit I [Spirochaetia bacterium]